MFHPILVMYNVEYLLIKLFTYSAINSHSLTQLKWFHPEDFLVSENLKVQLYLESGFTGDHER